MHFMKRIFSVLMLMSVGAVYAAQEPVMAPPPELKKMQFMVGEWTGKMKWTMAGVPAESSDMPFKVEWAGQFLKTSSTMTMAGMSMVETGYIGWDAKRKDYTSWTFSNFAPMPRIEHGKFEGDKFISVSEPWDTGMGEPTVGRATTTKVTDIMISFLLEFKEGDKWNKVAEGTFTKKN